MSRFEWKIGLFSIIICILNLNFIQCLPLNNTISPTNAKEVKLLVVNNKPKAFDNKTVVKYQDQKAGDKKAIENGKGDSFKETYGSSDEVEYHKVFHTKGSKGYDNFETFHKKDSNEYELKDEDKTGKNKKSKHEKRSHESKEYDKDSETHKHGKKLIEEDVSLSFEGEDYVEDDKSKEKVQNNNSESEYSSEEIESTSDEKSRKQTMKPKSNKKKSKLIKKSLPHTSELEFTQKIRDKHKHKICKKPSKRRLLSKNGLPFIAKSNSAVLKNLPQTDNILKIANKNSDSNKILQKTYLVPTEEMKTSENSNIQIFSMQSGILSSKLPISQNFKQKNKTISNGNSEPFKMFSNSTINNNQMLEVIQPQALSQVEANFIPNKSFGYDTIIYHDEEDVAQSLKNDSPDEKNSIINFYSPDLELKSNKNNENNNYSGSKEELSELSNPLEPENSAVESEDIVNESQLFINNDPEILHNEENLQEHNTFSEKPTIVDSIEAPEIEAYEKDKQILNHRMEALEQPEYRPRKKKKLKHSLKISLKPNFTTETNYEDEALEPEPTTEPPKVKKEKKKKKKSKKRIKTPKNESVESTIKKLELKNLEALRASANETEKAAQISEQNSRKFIDENVQKFTESPTTEDQNPKRKTRKKHKEQQIEEKSREILTEQQSSEENLDKKNQNHKHNFHPTRESKNLRNERDDLRNNEHKSKPMKKYSTNQSRPKQKPKKRPEKITTTQEPEIYYDDESSVNEAKPTEEEPEIYYDEIKNLDNQDFVIVVDDDKKIQASKSKQSSKPKPKYRSEESNEDVSDENDSENIEDIPQNIQNKNVKVYNNESSEESNEPNSNGDECSNCDYDYEEE